MITREYDLQVGEAVVFGSDDGCYRISVLDIDDESEEILVQITGTGEVVVRLGDRSRESWGMPKCKGYPRFWIWFSLILSHSVRHDIFTPTFNEFVEDYLLSKKQARTKWEKRWVACVFQIRTIVMILTCLRIQFVGRTATWWQWIVTVLWLSRSQ